MLPVEKGKLRAATYLYYSEYKFFALIRAESDSLRGIGSNGIDDIKSCITSRHACDNFTPAERHPTKTTVQFLILFQG